MMTSKIEQLKAKIAKQKTATRILQKQLDVLVTIEHDTARLKRRAQRLERKHDYLSWDWDTDAEVWLWSSHPSAYLNNDVEDDHDEDLCPADTRHIYLDGHADSAQAWQAIVDVFELYVEAAETLEAAQ
tara:strand:- start:379 stop:765 length:387 start_codon:yes stop_codon:yes gene_type:complete